MPQGVSGLVGAGAHHVHGAHETVLGACLEDFGDRFAAGNAVALPAFGGRATQSGLRV